MTPTAPVVFIDTETTGLDPDRHEIWEIAVIQPDGAEAVYHPTPKHFERADPTALRITRFYERQNEGGWPWQKRSEVAFMVASLLAGQHLVAAVPSFDAAFLNRFLRANGEAPSWHYHLVDVEALAAGRLGIAPPWDSKDLATRLGIDPASTEFGKHTALGDARWAKAIYDAALA